MVASRGSYEAPASVVTSSSLEIFIAKKKNKAIENQHGAFDRLTALATTAQAKLHSQRRCRKFLEFASIYDWRGKRAKMC